MARLNNRIMDIIARALSAELGGVLDVEVEDLDTWRASLDLPGPVDVSIATDDGATSVTTGPLEVKLEDGDVTARLDLPGPDLEVSVVDGRVSGPRFVADDDESPLRFPKRGVVRAVKAGDHDDILEGLIVAEKAGKDRTAVVEALQRRVGHLAANPGDRKHVSASAAPAPATVDAPKPQPKPEPADLLLRAKRTVVRAVKSGDHDDHLEELLKAERAGENRGAVVRVLRKRLG